MAKNIDEVARALGAAVVGQIPDAGGGAFGAARLGNMVKALRTRLEPADGKRPGRPTDPSWVHHPKVPMSEATMQRLARLAESASLPGRRVSPMQMAAQLLEEAVTRCELVP